MKMNKKYCYILIVALSMTFGNAFASTDIFKSNNFGNVGTTINLGISLEEFNKVSIFGQLAEKLSKELNYIDLVYLDFKQHFRAFWTPAFFISYENVEYWNADSSKWLKKDGIVIRQIARQFNAQTTLKLLEHAILNLESIKSSQEEIVFNDMYRDLKINTIDTLVIKNTLNNPNSDVLNKVLKQRIDRPETDFRDGISYYWQDNRYYIFHHDFFAEEKENVIYELENIFDFKRFGIYNAVIFDTDSSFYYADHFGIAIFGEPWNRNKKISERQIIENISDSRRFEVEIFGKKVFISFSYIARWIENRYSMAGHKYRTLVYFPKENILIQDLDKLILNNFDKNNDEM